MSRVIVDAIHDFFQHRSVPTRMSTDSLIAVAATLSSIPRPEDMNATFHRTEPETLNLMTKSRPEPRSICRPT